jgi:hypothetical protein
MYGTTNIKFVENMFAWFLYCNHQVHRDILITLYNRKKVNMTLSYVLAASVFFSTPARPTVNPTQSTVTSAQDALL